MFPLRPVGGACALGVLPHPIAVDGAPGLVLDPSEVDAIGPVEGRSPERQVEPVQEGVDGEGEVVGEEGHLALVEGVGTAPEVGADAVGGRQLARVEVVPGEELGHGGHGGRPFGVVPRMGGDGRGGRASPRAGQSASAAPTRARTFAVWGVPNGARSR